MMERLSDKDIAQIEDKGLTPEDIEWQLNNFETGFPFLPIVKAASAGDGIARLNQEEIDHFKMTYRQTSSSKKIVKFVPASGAASRMFKFLFEYLNDADNHSGDDVAYFMGHIERFAFFEDLRRIMEKDELSIYQELEDENYQTVIDYLLTPRGLNYGSLPKGLIKFHKYMDTTRTACEEHWVEGASYAKNHNQTSYIHFTISPEHKELFDKLFRQRIPEYESSMDVNIHNEYSYQKEYTDMVAVDPENRFFRNPDGSILFRPGGHGALLENLNDLDADLVFIKNIDNVIPDRYKVLTYEYKRALAGMLLDHQSKIFKYLKMLEHPGDLSEEKIEEMKMFLEHKLHHISPEDTDLSDKNKAVDYLFRKFNRPIRVCGMVKNQGEPGGGPFWVRNDDGTIALQIIEKAQINMEDPQQKKILQSSSHFNPVDLVCGLTNYKGERFDLMKFRDPTTGIISQKSKDGKTLKAQELPGLWNGGMADWNTLFVEVPILTFTPVKTVNDLLREEHQ